MEIMECDDNSDLEKILQPHHQTHAEVRAFAFDFANQENIEVEMEDKARIQYVMKKYRICRCTRENCKSIFSGGKISCI
jgi:hypothetical protein